MTVAYTCPHCGATMLRANLSQHAPRCPSAPGMPARIRAALADPGCPGMALSVRAYKENAIAAGLPGPDALRRAWGDWPAVCARVGLVPGRASGYGGGIVQQRRTREVEAIAEVEEMLEADARLRESLRTRGLEVCAVREIDGGRRVAYMLR